MQERSNTVDRGAVRVLVVEPADSDYGGAGVGFTVVARPFSG